MECDAKIWSYGVDDLIDSCLQFQCNCDRAISDYEEIHEDLARQMKQARATDFSKMSKNSEKVF